MKHVRVGHDAVSQVERGGRARRSVPAAGPRSFAARWSGTTTARGVRGRAFARAKGDSRTRAAAVFMVGTVRVKGRRVCRSSSREDKSPRPSASLGSLIRVRVPIRGRDGRALVAARRGPAR
jgi:hypothetical protein